MNPLAPIGHVAVTVAVNPSRTHPQSAGNAFSDKLVSEHDADHLTAVLVKAPDTETFHVARPVQSNWLLADNHSESTRLDLPLVIPSAPGIDPLGETRALRHSPHSSTRTISDSEPDDAPHRGPTLASRNRVTDPAVGDPWTLSRSSIMGQVAARRRPDNDGSQQKDRAYVFGRIPAPEAG